MSLSSRPLRIRGNFLSSSPLPDQKILKLGQAGDSNATVTSHINKLPAELMALIFEACLALRTQPGSPHITPDENKVPYVFLHVCVSWKKIALSLHTLWNHVEAPKYTTGTTTEDSDRLRGFISSWLTVSREWPLHLRHASPGYLHDGEIAPTEMAGHLKKGGEYHAAQMLFAFLDHERRWRTLEIEFDGYLVKKFQTALQKYQPKNQSAPCFGARLRRLQIAVDESCKLINMETLLGWIRNLPELEILELEDHDKVLNLNIVPFEQPKVFIFSRVLSYRESVAIASRCTSATALTLHGGDETEARRMIAACPSMHSLPNLKQLLLDDVQCPLDVLKALVLPSLEVLEVSSGLAGCTNGYKTFAVFLEQSWCSNLKRLVSYSVFNAEEAAQYLEIPFLQSVGEVSFAIDQREAIRVMALAEKLDFMVWKKKTANGAVESSEPEYRIGWKALDGDEALEFEYKEGVFRSAEMY